MKIELELRQAVDYYFQLHKLKEFDKEYRRTEQEVLRAIRNHARINTVRVAFIQEQVDKLFTVIYVHDLPETTQKIMGQAATNTICHEVKILARFGIAGDILLQADDILPQIRFGLIER